MAEKSQINNPRIGMNMDQAPQDLKETQYVYALNAVVQSGGDQADQLVLQNENSNRLALYIPAGYKVNGLRAVPEQNRTIFALVNPLTGDSRLGEVLDCIFDDSTQDGEGFVACDTCTHIILAEEEPLEKTSQQPYCTFHTIVSDPCLKFSIDHPVRMRYKIVDGQLNLYFTDNNEQRRFLYFDYDVSGHLKLQDRFKVITGYDAANCDQPVYGTRLDCNKTVFHPRYSIPCIHKIHDVSGGTLKAGVYQFFLAYTDKEGNPLTNYFPATNPYPIFTRPQTFETDYSTDRAIKFSVEGLDTDLLYRHYTVVVAETVENFTSFKQVGTFPVHQRDVTYSGRSEKDLSEADVFFRTAFYSKASGIATANNYLLFSDLSSWQRPNLQRAANRVKLYWQTAALPEPVYSDPRSSVRFRGYQRDEVYSFGLVFVTHEGEELGSYHIPGPSRQWLLSRYGLDVGQTIDNDDVVKEDQCLDNCCGSETGNSTLEGSLTLGCTDEGCTQQGLQTLQFTFPTATTKNYTLYLGHIVRWPLNDNQRVGQGFSIYSRPSDVSPYIYFDYPESPFVVNIPAGVTSFSISDVQIQKYDVETGSHWICHDCIFPVTDVYIKVAEAGVDADFTTSQDWTLHNVPGDPIAVDEDCVNCEDEIWKVYNTAAIVQSPHEVINSCDDEDKVWEWGEFAYWESSEKYPDDPKIWGELCGQPIRHHKMPDSLVTHIHDAKNGTKGFQDGNIVYPLGIRVDHQSVVDALDYCVAQGIISQKDRERIASYRVVRGNRVGNKSIVAKGLLFDMWKYNKWQKDYYYPNYPYNDLRPDSFIAPQPNYTGQSTTSPAIASNFTPTGRYTFHSPDTHFNNPHIGSRLKLETLEYGQSEGYFNKCEDQAKYKLASTAALTLALGAGAAIAFSTVRGDKECTQYTFKSSSTTAGTEISHTTWSEHLFLPYNKDTGLKLSVPVLVESKTETTCKGSPYQLLNNPLGPLFWLTGGVGGIGYLSMKALKEMDIVAELIESLIPYKNLAVQYNSVGKYNNFKTIPNSGGKIRAILKSAYLDPKIQQVSELVDASTGQHTTTFINNLHRESSVYLKIDSNKKFASPAVADQSRFTLNQKGLKQDDLLKRVNAPISAYYASIKNYLPDQWGRVSSIEYLPTGTCDFRLDRSYTLSQSVVFGGDSFISRFALKRKMPFFIQTRFGMVNDADVKYEELGNVGFPNYYFNSKQPIYERLGDIKFNINSIGDAYQRLIGVPKSRLDAKENKVFYQSGFIHLYSYGIPYFFAESDVNCDYRYAQNHKERDFYPHQKDLDYWLQERNVPITEDNYFFYNRSYSKQNKEAFIAPQVLRLQDTSAQDHSSVIQSEQEQFRPDIDKWLVFKPNNKHRFNPSVGRVVGLDGIENDKVLVRFENGAQIFGAYATLKSDSGDIAVGNGGIFNSPMKEFSSTSLGYAGSQHADMLQTPFGHIWVDAKRGNVLNLLPNAAGLDELTGDGLRSWFQKNLPFQLKKDFPQIPTEDLDNNFKGLGITMAYDRKYSRILITKLDYHRLDREVRYDTVSRKFYKGQTEVSLDDLRYFCSKSWTLSYNFLTKGWTSFHSYLPNYYVSHLDYFQGGYYDGSLWSHSVTARSFQVFKGKLAPFKVEIVAAPMMLGGILHSVSYLTEARRYQGPGDFAVNKYITFNKAIIYNDQQSSGPLELHVRDENNLAASVEYPKVEDEANQILVTNLKGVWHFNQFWDTVSMQPNNQPLMLHNCAHSDKLVNAKPLNLYKPDVLKQRIEGRNTRIRLIQDAVSNYNLLFTIVKTQLNGS